MSAPLPLETTLHATRRRVTEQRRLLLEIIRAHGEHLDADQIYALARQQNPRLSLSTVYRTLSLLRDLGLVDEVHLGEDHHHYELKPAAAHHHLICRVCGRVTEFSTFLADELAASVGAEYGYDVQEVRIDLMGLCAQCRDAQEQETGESAPRGTTGLPGGAAPVAEPDRCDDASQQPAAGGRGGGRRPGRGLRPRGAAGGPRLCAGDRAQGAAGQRATGR